MDFDSKEAKFMHTLAEHAGKITWKYFCNTEVTIKSDHTPVTQADLEINSYVVDEVKKHFPEYGVLGEEESHKQENKKLFVVDPVDGTVPYSIGSPTSCFSIAEVIDGEPVRGLAYNPFAKRMLYAEKGKGAFMNKKHKLQVSKLKPEADVYPVIFLTNSWYKYNIVGVDELLTYWKARVINSGAMVEHSSLVAFGTGEGAVYAGVGADNIAAVKVIVEEAGGKVTDWDGNEQRYDGPINGGVVSNGHFHDEIVNLMNLLRGVA